MDPELQSVGSVVEWVVATICQWTLAAFLVRGTYEHVRGRRIGLDAMLYHGVSRLLPALGIALLSGLIIGGIVFTFLLVLGCMGALLRFEGGEYRLDLLRIEGVSQRELDPALGGG